MSGVRALQALRLLRDHQQLHPTCDLSTCRAAEHAVERATRTLLMRPAGR